MRVIVLRVRYRRGAGYVRVYGWMVYGRSRGCQTVAGDELYATLHIAKCRLDVTHHTHMPVNQHTHITMSRSRLCGCSTYCILPTL